ncbi:MAG: response regulator [Myxococcaceae bacterium]
MKKLYELNSDMSRLSVEYDLSPQVELTASPRLMQQLTLNLMNNARDALSGRGRIKVVVHREGSQAVLMVADWGPGIAPELREKIFEPYVTNKAKGSGLGLAVCKRIAAEHGATIGLASPNTLTDQPPPATIFRVVFPTQAVAEKPQKRRLLVVDDEAIIRQVFKDLMSRECEVVEAETAEAAIALLHGQRFDLIVSDKNLPGLSGLDLAQAARKQNAQSKVMLMTGYPSLVTAQQALELGVIDYLLKPFDDIREVRDKIRHAFNAPLPQKSESTVRRVDVYEDNPLSARQISEALLLLGIEARVLTEPKSSDEVPVGVVVSWDFTPSPGKASVELARTVSRGSPFIILAEHLTMDTALESLRGGATACLPKLLSDVRALSRELARALKLAVPP